MLSPTTRFAVIGHGSWATALVKIITDSGIAVDWYVRNSEVLDSLRNERFNPKYLRDVHFRTDSFVLHSDINSALKCADVVILATPSAFLKNVMREINIPLSEKFVISTIKGIVPDEYITIAEYLNQFWGLPFDNIGVLTGPCHAEEVAQERLSYLTLACKSEDRAMELATAFNCGYIRTSTSTDIYGTEYSAVLKNIYAIAVGMCHTLGYGDNFTSVLIANAAIEMQRFMDSTYKYPRQVLASAYLGDLLVTCYSGFSRNRSFGQLIAKGFSVKIVQMEMGMVAEGYYAAACIKQIISQKSVSVDMPIADAVYSILYEGKSAKTEIKKILDKFI